MDVRTFEEKRWTHFTQKPEHRHRAALNLISDGSVLDVGCGDGLFLSLLSEKRGNAEGLVGIDISEEAVARARDKGIDARVAPLSATLPFPDNSFTYIVLLDVLEHVYDPEALLKEAKRVSIEYVVISVPNFSSLPARLQTLMGRIPENNRPGKGHVFWFTFRELKRIVSSAELSIDALSMNTFRPLPAFLARVFPSLCALSFVARLK